MADLAGLYAPEFESAASVGSIVALPEQLLQTIEFSNTFSYLSLAFLSNQFDGSQFFTEQNFDPSEPLKSLGFVNALCIPSIMSSGIGTIHPMSVKMNSSVISSGPLVSLDAKSLGSFLELYESIENIVHTIFLLYPPELKPDLSELNSSESNFNEESEFYGDSSDTCILIF